MRGQKLPLTLLEKRWLKAILLDPRLRLFDCELKGLEEVEPLFLPDDIHIFDKYADGDSYDNEKYIQNFRTIMDAIAARCPLRIDVENRRGMLTHIKALPEYMEYSEKDDKFRLITSGCRYGRTINLARILSCKPCPLQDEDAVGAACGKRNGEAHTGSNGKRSGDLCGTSRESTESLVFELFDGRTAVFRCSRANVQNCPVRCSHAPLSFLLRLSPLFSSRPPAQLSLPFQALPDQPDKACRASVRLDR